MRQIKFRGKRNDQDEWVFGDLIEENGGDTYIVQANIIQWKQFEADPDTVSQFTGLTDRNGKEIYEGDIVKVVDSDNEVDPLDSDTGIGEVIFLVESGLWYISSTIHNGLFDINDSYYIEIIGNIHDNPELLNEKQ